MTFEELGAPPSNKIAEWDYWVSMYYAGLGIERGTPLFKGYTFDYTDFQDAALSSSETILSLPAKGFASFLIFSMTTQFAGGGGLSALTAKVGTSGDDDLLMGAFNLLQTAPADRKLSIDPDIGIISLSSANDLIVKLEGDVNLSNLSAGAFDIWIAKTTLPTPV